MNSRGTDTTIATHDYFHPTLYPTLPHLTPTPSSYNDHVMPISSEMMLSIYKCVTSFIYPHLYTPAEYMCRYNSTTQVFDVFLLINGNNYSPNSSCLWSWFTFGGHDMYPVCHEWLTPEFIHCLGVKTLFFKKPFFLDRNVNMKIWVHSSFLPARTHCRVLYIFVAWVQGLCLSLEVNDLFLLDGIA